MKEFNIGDRVVSLPYDCDGVVEDKVYSHKKGEWVYVISFDDGDVAPHFECDLEVCREKTYRWDVFQADNNVVTAVMYEIVDGMEYEVDRKHGHIIHHGAIGFAQAASYAMKKIYVGMNDGKLIETEGN